MDRRRRLLAVDLAARGGLRAHACVSVRRPLRRGGERAHLRAAAQAVPDREGRVGARVRRSQRALQRARSSLTAVAAGRSCTAPPACQAAPAEIPRAGARPFAAYKLSNASVGPEEVMANSDRRNGGISLGGILVIVGIVLMIIWSFWIGLIIALIGLIAFGGFARGKWY